MTDTRTINKIVVGQRAVDGAGVKLVRVIGHSDTQEFDPFLMLDAFDSANPEDYIKGFPWHPHRGIETITYLVQGDIEHSDSLGNKGGILDGECQWMTAGSGILHQEMPKPSTRMLGVQLWLNLPAKNKMVAPKYHDITQTAIPVVEAADHKIHVVAGSYNGVAGALQGDYVQPLFLDVELKPGAVWSLDTEPAATLFVYILQGAGAFGPLDTEFIQEKHVILFNAGLDLQVQAADSGVRFLLLSGQPLGEPIAWGGPIVMNTREQLNTAFRELDNNTFIKR